jgi:ATP-dependent Clp protease ATP-binding subunit ClpA
VSERFTERARQVVVLAQRSARELNHDYIGTEHLLMGLLREDESLAAQVAPIAQADGRRRARADHADCR